MTKPVIKVYLLPAWSEDKLLALHADIVEAVVGVPELKLKTENDFYTLFPSDLMLKGLGSDIVVEMMIPMGGHIYELELRIIARVTSAIKKHLPDAYVQCTLNAPAPYETPSFSPTRTVPGVKKRHLHAFELAELDALIKEHWKTKNDENIGKMMKPNLNAITVHKRRLALGLKRARGRGKH